jgi:hypothetical protein
MEDNFENILKEAHADTSIGATAPPDVTKRLSRAMNILRLHPPPDEPGAYLVVAGWEETPYSFKLSDSVVVGRSEQASLVLPHEWVSARHCSIHSDGEDWIMRDLDSTNGTCINGKKKASHILHQGDVILLGKDILIFVTVSD